MFKPFPITPGIYKDYTDYLAEPHYVDSNFVRFQGGVAEQMGDGSTSYQQAIT